MDAEQFREAELIGRAQTGDRDALEAALLAQHAACFGFALRLTGNAADAEDVCQDAFVRVARDIKAWRPTGGGGSFRSWLLRMVLCAHQNRRAAESARRQRERSYAMIQETAGVSAANTAENAELKKHLEGALANVGDTYRLPLLLHYEQGLSRSEVAAVLEIPEGTVATHLRRGVERLRELLTQAGFECPAPVVIAALGSAATQSVPAGLSAAIHGIAAGTGKGGATAAGTSGLAALAKVKLAALLAAAVLAAGAATLMTHRFAAAPLSAPVAETKDDAKPEAPLPYPPTTLSGMVIDANTNKPLAGMRVTVRNDAHEKLMPLPGATLHYDCPSTLTDEQGRYTLRFMTDARVVLRQTMVYTDDERYQSAYVYADVYQGETVAMSPIKLTAFQTVRGRVIDPDGKPVADALVKNHPFGEARTDRDGYFTETHVATNQITWVVVADGFELKGLTYSIDAQKAALPEIQLARCKAVTGTVLAGENNPLSDIAVFAGSYPSLSVLPNWSVSIDQNGHFSMGTMWGGSLYLMPVCKGEIVGDPVKVEPGQTGVTLQLYSRGKLTVNVKDPDGKPVENAQVSAHRTELYKSRWITTGADGQAVFAELPAGEVNVQVTTLMGRQARKLKMPEPVTVQIEPGKAAAISLSCTVDPTTADTITGYLQDDRGQPLLHVALEACLLKAEGDKRKIYRGRAMTEVDGRFEMELAYDSGERDGFRREIQPPDKPGKVHFVAELAGFDGSIMDEVKDWPATGTTLDLKNCKLTIAPERIIVVKGERPGNTSFTPLVTGCVDARGQTVVYKKQNYAEAEPRLSVRAVGPLTLKVEDGLGHKLDVAIPADARTEAPVVARFPAPRHVEITVLDAAGKPVDGVALHARHHANSLWPFSSKWSDKGKFTFEIASEAGSKFVLYDGLKHQPYFGEITPGDKPIVETIHLKDPDAVVSGRITTMDGKAPPPVRGHLEVELKGWLSTSVEFPVDAQGNFKLSVPSGLTVTATGTAETKENAWEARSEAVTLTPGQHATLDAPLDKRSERPWERKPTVKPKPAKPAQPSKDDF